MRAILVASLVLAVSPFSTSGQEASWRKVTLSGWRKQLQDPSSEARHAAAMEFMFMDLTMVKQAIPDLREALKDENRDVCNCAWRSLTRCDRTAASSVPNMMALLEKKVIDAKATEPQEDAVEALGNLGDSAAVPVLIRQLGINPQLDDAVALALYRLGAAAKPALPALKQLIRKDSPPEILAHAGMAIAFLEPDAPEVKQAIILLTPIQRIVKWSDGPPFLNAEFLVRFPDLTIKHLVPLLEDKDPKVRRGAARVLFAAGTKAKEEATAPLQKALQDPEAEVRVAMVRALFAVAPDNCITAIPILVKLLGPKGFYESEVAHMLRSYQDISLPLLIRELDSETRESVIGTLSSLRQYDYRSMPRLDAETIARRDALIFAALGDPSLMIRRGAAAVIRQLGTQVSAAVPSLLELAKDADAEARLDAIEALVAVDPGHHSWLIWLPSLEEVVREKNRYAQHRAIAQIRGLGPAAKAAAPTLLTAVDENEKEVRLSAAVALIYVDPSQRIKVLPTLLEEIKKQDSPWISDTAEALAEFGPVAKEALPALKAALAKKEDAYQHGKLIKALTRIDRAQIPPCRQEAEALLKDPRSGRLVLILDVLVLLPEWGAEAKPLAPVLRDLATNERINARIQIAAAVSLVLIGSDENDTGLNILRKAVNTPTEGAKREHLLRIADRLGPLAKPLAADLRPLTTDPSLGEYARVVLAKIDPKME